MLYAYVNMCVCLCVCVCVCRNVMCFTTFVSRGGKGYLDTDFLVFFNLEFNNVFKAHLERVRARTQRLEV